MLFALFAASGFAGLIYESIWTHYLQLFLGHAAYAQTLVLGIFMGGLALGSWLSSRWSARWRDLLVAYAATEAAIGVLGLAFHHAFVAATAMAYDRVLPRLAGSTAAVTVFKWSLAALLILPQSVLLGMTFPLMTAGVLRVFSRRPGQSLAMLYFTNSLGAVAGVLVSGFVLIAAVGLPGTVRTAALINFAVAGAVWWSFRGHGKPALVIAQEDRRDRAYFFFLAAALITGASSFIYEVAWLRMLALVLGSSTHAFELMLSAFILGLALGGLWIQRRIDQLATPVRTLAYLQIAMGVLALATLFLYGQTFAVMRWVVSSVPHDEHGYAVFSLWSHGIAAAIMLPATFCAGTTLPLITFHLMKRGHGEASIGAVYAANTVGAIAGVFCAVHLGLPLLGLKGLLTLGGALDVALGAVLLWTVASAFADRRVPRALTAAGAAAIAVALLFGQLDAHKMASGVFRHGGLLEPADRVLFQRDGKTATVSVVSNDERARRGIRTNGKTDAEVTTDVRLRPSGDEPTMALLAAVPMALHPSAQRAACIGFGSGVTTHLLLTNPRLRQVDTIEIEREMVRGAEHFRPSNELAYSDPRSRIVIDDAKTFFATQPEKYDLIVSEPSNPWVSGVAGLFSDEFYRLVRRHLAHDGVLVQWLQLYEIDVPLVVSVLRAIEANFADYVVYASSDFDLLIAASDGRKLGPPDVDVLNNPLLAPALARVGVRGAQDLEVRRVGDRKSWQGLSRAVPIPANSDYFPVLDQNAAKTRFLGVSALPLPVFASGYFPVLEMLSGFRRPGEVTYVTSAPYFDGSRRAWEATWLRDVLVQRQEVTNKVVAWSDLHEQAQRLSRWLRTCDAPALPLPDFIPVAQLLITDLKPPELDAVWRSIDSACGGNPSQRERSWLDFFRAAGHRDGTAMAVTARRLLDMEVTLTGPTQRYLVVAGLLGSIASGDVAGARDLWTRYSSPVGGTDDLLLRVLVARLGAQ